MKNLFCAFWLSLLLASATALAYPMAEADSSYNARTEQDFNIVGQSMVIDQQEIIEIKIVKPMQRKASYQIPESVQKLLDQNLVHQYWLYGLTNGQRDTIQIETNHWQGIKLFPPWSVPLLHGERTTHIITIDDLNRSFVDQSGKTPANQKAPVIAWLFWPLFALGFWFFWLIRVKAKENKFHPFGWFSFGYYLLALGFLNLTVIYDKLFLSYMIMIVVASVLLGHFSPVRGKKRWSEDWRLIISAFHLLIFFACYGVIMKGLLLPQLDLNYLHLNVLLISYIACGKLSAWLLLLVWKAIFKKPTKTKPEAITS
ncbi:hypothetical protein H6761_03950 [Candidatus Nomurabacteria bacterium]|nr:hypothetical protein [Candidatus Nomurabacteria bacterium]